MSYMNGFKWVFTSLLVLSALGASVAYGDSLSLTLNPSNGAIWGQPDNVGLGIHADQHQRSGCRDYQRRLLRCRDFVAMLNSTGRVYRFHRTIQFLSCQRAQLGYSIQSTVPVLEATESIRVWLLDLHSWARSC